LFKKKGSPHTLAARDDKGTFHLQIAQSQAELNNLLSSEQLKKLTGGELVIGL